jgi:ribonucleoside-triphosphate reductase
VQNWNDGKLQEFKQRKVYAAGASFANTQKVAAPAPKAEVKTEPHQASAAVKTQVQAAAAANRNEDSRMLLFTTRTCPNCKAAKDMLQKAGLAYTTVVAEEKPELAEQYGIQMAPTIVVMKDDQPTRITGLADIRQMVEQAQN